MFRYVDLPFIEPKPPEEGGYPGLNPQSRVSDGMRIEKDVAVPLRDGTRIYVDISRPEGAADVPVLIAYGPYGKHRGFPPVLAAGADVEEPFPDDAPFEAPLARYWVADHGYAVIYVDPRGTWGSEGDATFISQQEAEDGYDLVEWAGTRPWSNGKVGMSGVSYLALSQYAIAATRPPHLAAINPSEGLLDWYRDRMYIGGIPETRMRVHWADLVNYGRGKSEDVLGGVLAHPLLDDYWEAKLPDLERIEVPAFFVCSVGNHGLHTRGTLEAYRRVSSAQKWLDVHGRKEWRHYYNIDSMDRQRAFFDHFLKGLDTEVSSWPPTRVEYRDRTETGPIRDEKQWPPEQVRPIGMYLDGATGQLSPAAGTESATVGYDPTRSPIEPSRHAGEEKAVFSLTFETDTELAGSAALRLWAASPGADDMDVFVTLDKLDNNGQVVPYPFWGYLDDGPLAMGWLRASHRELDPRLSTPERPIHTHRRRLPLPDGEPVALDIEIWPFTAHFHAGETLRLTIAGAEIYRAGPDAFVMGHDALNNTAPHVLYTGGPYDSRLLLLMMARETEVTAAGVGRRRSAGEATSALVRQLGAFERLYHRLQQKSTQHFCVVAELADDIDPFTLAGGLRAVQQRHPLLNVHVEDHPETGLGFYRPASVPPIPITDIDAEAGRSWRDVVAAELTRPFDTSRAPMVRVMLLRSGPSTPAAIVLTVDHVIVDGLSAGYILRDLLAALNGHPLQALPVPPSQEELIGVLRDGQPGAERAANGQPQPVQPDWLSTRSIVRPFDGAAPHISTVCFDQDLTRRLVTRARAEDTTVHSALVSAMTRVIIESGRNEFVRMNSPVAFRSHIGVHDDVCLYFTVTRTAFTREQLTDLWDMARTVGDQLTAARSLPAVLAGSAAVEQFIPVDATTQDAEDFMVAGLSFEAFASNLGVLDMGTPEAVRPVAIWGPALLGQVQGELATGICTFNGQLRMVTASHDPLPGYLDRLRDVLDAAC
jgi:predicted acyl esterase